MFYHLKIVIVQDVSSSQFLFSVKLIPELFRRWCWFKRRSWLWWGRGFRWRYGRRSCSLHERPSLWSACDLHVWEVISRDDVFTGQQLNDNWSYDTRLDCLPHWICGPHLWPISARCCLVQPMRSVVDIGPAATGKVSDCYWEINMMLVKYWW